MESGSKKLSKRLRIPIKIPSPESILYIILVAALMLTLIYFFRTNIVVPTRVKTIYREYVPKYFSDFVFFFYSILVVPSAFRPIWFIFWPLLFYVIGKRFFNGRKIKYFLAVIGLSLAYIFYAIPNHYIVPIAYTFKPTEFYIDQEFPELCKEKNVMVFAPPDIHLLNPERILDWYVGFKEDWSNYVGTNIHYICVGNGTSVNVSFTEWNPNRRYCPSDIELEISSERYNEILVQPPSLFPMFVFDCDYVVSPYESATNRKEWIDIFCFNSGFTTPECFLHLLNPYRGVFSPPEHLLVSTIK